MRTKILWLAAVCALVASCADESYTTVPAYQLTFSADTVRLDTVFAGAPSPTKSLWAYNDHASGLRLRSVRLERGNQTGFRVNVDGIYLGKENGWQAQDLEVRHGDSIRAYVELTAPPTAAAGLMRRVEDNLVFAFESGAEQRVHLEADAWEARWARNLRVAADTTIAAGSPVVVYGDIVVDSTATLTLAAGTQLYFHAGAGIDVAGRLLVCGAPGQEVVLRGDRLDHMFDYLPYDNVSGQWKGIHLRASSYDNTISYMDLHGAFDGIVADSAALDRAKLLLSASTIHNCQGYGLAATSCAMAMENVQVSNTLKDCVCLAGGTMTMNACTLAQFYPFDANRGAALRFDGTDRYPCFILDATNTLITGYADDVIFGDFAEDGTPLRDYRFDHCLLRTPRVETADSLRFTAVVYEDPSDTLTTGRRHFQLVDIDQQRYCFDLDTASVAIGCADPLTAPPLDRLGRRRDDAPDIGAYECPAPTTEATRRRVRARRK